MTAIWVRGLLTRRWGRLLATAAGVAAAVALLAAYGSFLAASEAAMTRQASRQVAVDWQVAVAPGAAADSVLAATAAEPGVGRALPVEFASTSWLSATAAGSTQTTGSGVVLGLPAGYRTTFPSEIRTLVGTDSGPVLAQQTAANLHGAPGTTVTIARPGRPPATVVISGVVELPQANSLFQKVGAPSQSQPSAPPDNVVLLPGSQFHQIFGPVPSVVTTQIHVARTAALPTDPQAAFTEITAAAHHLEAKLAGAGTVGDNLGAVLDAARADALYARILFLFLGMPGILLAVALTAAVAGSGADRRRREQSLLRTRGALRRQVLTLAAIEAVLLGVIGSAVGLGVAAVLGLSFFESPRFGASAAAAWLWGGLATGVGLAVALAVVLVPAWRETKATTVVAGRATGGRRTGPWWARYGLDLILIAGAALVLWSTNRSGYTLVLAPEGVPSISVDYWAFLGPGLFWIGAALLTWRLVDLLLGRGRPLVTRLLRPIGGPLAPTIAAMFARQRRLLARGVVLVALALSFAISTAIFNSTFQQQSEVDARLTNGADVTVTEPPGSTVGPAAAATIATLPRVHSVEPLQHRFAYVGTDLQDLYGIRPDTIAAATSLQDGYFSGGTAAQLMSRLSAQPDGILVSAETVKEFQLRLGDRINLRLQDARTKQLTTVGFHYLGIAKEFPTAPKDSFLVANASYIAKTTGSDAVGAFLVDTGGASTTTVAAQIQARLGTSATVGDIATSRHVVSSSLTAVDLAGLTDIELGFALLLGAGAGGLVLALGFTERRRAFSILRTLGSTTRQLAGVLLGEAVLTLVGGALAGSLAGWALAEMLVAVLAGVFDPPPDRLAVPWDYLGGVLVVTVAAVLAAALTATARASRATAGDLRER
ncbi:hypothetical protein GCM10009765_76780 [Fodinicola feengrottensis]|uniref:ABC3 transporter permease C-terminal domain-containing protein n=1 Tax=Fodinicola feengrottensis TaxID=435914 RepID=A0ABP4V5V4_9ACTN